MNVKFRYRDFTECIGRNTERFCATSMKVIKYLFNVVVQLIGKSK